MPQLVARRLVAAAALSASALTPVALGATTTSADAAQAKTCSVERTYVKSTERGSAVWIPTNKHFSPPTNPSGWQQGGTQGYSESDGAQTSKTKGSADTVGGGIGLGPVSAKYDRQWNRSTAKSNSVTKSWQQSVTLPQKVSRMRIYQAGWHFKFTVVVVKNGGERCPDNTYTSQAVLPTKAKVTVMLVELYSKRNQLRARG